MRAIRQILAMAGLFFIVLLVVAFSSWPYWGYHWLGTSKSELKWEPEVIVLLGGSGMPSESNLIRCWHAARAYATYPDSRMMIVMPGDTSGSNSTPAKIRDELIIRGINPAAILFEPHGTNTRSQAMECMKIMDGHTSILLITSPEHMRRAVLCFRKAGFSKVNALSAFEHAAEADFTFKDENLGGRRTLIPDAGQRTQFRYQVWNHLKYEILIAKELTALAYYKLRGWI